MKKIAQTFKGANIERKRNVKYQDLLVRKIETMDARLARLETKGPPTLVIPKSNVPRLAPRRATPSNIVPTSLKETPSLGS
jgi:hypothetical protein